MRAGFLFFLMLAVITPQAAYAAQTKASNTPAAQATISAAEVQNQLYSNCIKSSGKVAEDTMKSYCRCSAKGISEAMSASDITSLAASAGNNASKEDVSKTMMSDGRFMGVIQRCLNESLGNTAKKAP